MSAMEFSEESEIYLFTQQNFPQVFIFLYIIKEIDCVDIFLSYRPIMEK
jgi:hypothetical protein